MRKILWLCFERTWNHDEITFYMHVHLCSNTTVHMDQRSTGWHEVTPVYDSALYLWTMGALVHSAIRQSREVVLACCDVLWPLKPKMMSAPCPCQFLRLRSQDFSSECVHTLDNTTRLTSAHWHASLWSTSPFPPCSHAALPQRVRTETLFSAVRRRKDLKFALQFSKIPSRKVSGLGCLVLQGFSSLYHKYPFLGFWSVARIPSRKVSGIGQDPRLFWKANRQRFKMPEKGIYGTNSKSLAKPGARCVNPIGVNSLVSE